MERGSCWLLSHFQLLQRCTVGRITVIKSKKSRKSRKTLQKVGPKKGNACPGSWPHDMLSLLQLLQRWTVAGWITAIKSKKSGKSKKVQKKPPKSRSRERQCMLWILGSRYASPLAAASTVNSGRLNYCHKVQKVRKKPPKGSKERQCMHWILASRYAFPFAAASTVHSGFQ
jgi:hypothetical protein